MGRNQNISFHKKGVKVRLPNQSMLCNWLGLVIRREGKSLGPLSFIYCSDSYLRSINRKYLKINKITDVIAFEYNEGKSISGDIYISVDRVRENAICFNVSYHAELSRVMVHGLLHLLGYRDKSVKDKTVMTKREDLYLSLQPK